MNVQKYVDNHPYSYMKRRDFLECVCKTYENSSTAHLVALRDALSIIINIRLNRNALPISMYEGYVKYE